MSQFSCNVNPEALQAAIAGGTLLHQRSMHMLENSKSRMEAREGCHAKQRNMLLRAMHHLETGRVSQHLIKACGKKIEGGENAAIGAQAILLHDIFVVYLRQQQQ